ncbi:MAG: malto-oligosyltrehalose synthase [Vicinamibacterales bacterium]
MTSPTRDRPAETPGTTYRLQLHGGFTLDDARAVVPYLAALGVTTCYCSPVFTAKPGSTHGYDVSRHTEINPELGGEAAFEAFAEALAASGMRLLLDFVPNHMSNDPRTNLWWRDVLENGPSSPFARYFDVDWDPVKTELTDRLLLPILGEQYGEALERGALRLTFDDGALELAYGDLLVPINPRRAPLVLAFDIEALEQTLGPDHADMREFLSVLTALRNLPPYTERDPAQIAERHREKAVARERLAALAARSDAVRAHIERAVAAFNGTPGDPASFDRLHELLELQAYRLASWRTASDEINYRRFFDINELAGLRVEDPEVFDEIHRLLLDLIASGKAAGVRLDHVDGLFDPQGYLLRLRDALASRSQEAGRAYVVVEKILSAGEGLRSDWPVAGTTGYTFLNDVNGVLVDGRQAKRLQRIRARFVGRQETFADVAYDSKRLIVSTALSSEFQVLTQAVNRLSEHDRRARDFTLGSIRRALREVVACFPVYRTYVTPAGATAADGEAVDLAVAEARRRNPAVESSIFDFLRAVLLPSATPDRPAPPGAMAVAMRVQQYTAPVQAKGVEDTACYRYVVLASLNEVGGEPSRFGRTVHEFHAANLARRRDWPGEMLASTTHDTKRSEDARARITALSEMPDAWQAAVLRWRRMNGPNRTRLGGTQAPDPNDEYLFYQTLVGAWPPELAVEEVPRQAPADLVARLAAYMHKAIKEAKLHTSWITPNAEYETAVASFVERTLTGRTAPAFLASFVPFVRRASLPGMVNALAQLVLKIVSPGVADFYQGTELWDLSLVDPDNRRPVDWPRRQALLDELNPWLSDATPARAGGHVPGRPAAVADWVAAWPDGRIKLFLTALGARLRRERPALFLDGAYEPLAAVGGYAEHVVAFARHLEGQTLVAVVPRLTSRVADREHGLPLGDAWGETAVALPATCRGRRLRDLVTGARLDAVNGPDDGPPRLPVSRILAVCPVALLWLEEARDAVEPARGVLE